jgi:DDE domain
MTQCFPLSLRTVEDLLHERGIEVSHETVRFWWNRFGPMFAAEIRTRRVEGMRPSHWRWHIDEVYVKINGLTHYLWRAVDHEVEGTRRQSHQDSRSQSSPQVLEEIDEAARPISNDRYRWPAVLRRRPEGPGLRR